MFDERDRSHALTARDCVERLGWCAAGEVNTWAEEVRIFYNLTHTLSCEFCATIFADFIHSNVRTLYRLFLGTMTRVQ